MMRQFKEVDAFLFDLGGVIVDIDPNAAIEAFTKLGLNNLQERITHGHHNGLFKQYELGAISTDVFVQSIQKELPHKVDEKEIIEAWSKMLVDLPVSRVELLKQIVQQKPVYLLSNTNEIHRNVYRGMAVGYKDIEPIFTKAYYSYEINLNKPDQDCFKYVVEHAGLIPERTLFLDDSQLNLDAAKALGFQTELVTKENPIELIFS
jgi:putative hydrolase of the HAD superfamily